MALLVTLHISHSVSGVHTEGDNTLAECIFNFYPVATKGGSALHYIKQLYTMQKITVTQLHEFDFHPVPNKGVSGTHVVTRGGTPIVELQLVWVRNNKMARVSYIRSFYFSNL